MSSETIVPCRFDRHGEAILAIFNEAILNSTALYDYEPRTLQSMEAWFGAKRRGGFPVIGLEDAGGKLLAFGSYGSFRAFPAYKYTVEHSVYVHQDHRGMGLGRRVLEELIVEARRNNLHAMVGAIDGANSTSIALHQRLGFQHVGSLPQVGFKFGRWLDLAFAALSASKPVTGSETFDS